MIEFLQRNSILLIFGALAIFYVWIIVSSRRRQHRAEEYLARSEADAGEHKRHNAAVEAKLDRIIELLEKDSR